MVKRVERTRAGETWTEARYFGFIRSALRKAWSRYPVRFQVLAEARRNKPKNKEGRHKFEFRCSKCKKWKQQKEVEVDHIVSCGSLKKYDDLPGFVERLLCEKEDLRVVCKPCHKKITAANKEAAKEKENE